MSDIRVQRMEVDDDGTILINGERYVKVVPPPLSFENVKADFLKVAAKTGTYMPFATLIWDSIVGGREGMGPAADVETQITRLNNARRLLERWGNESEMPKVRQYLTRQG